MHCVLFRIPPGTTREAVLQKLATDQRVLIAQPLNEFESGIDAAPLRRSVREAAGERQRARRRRGAPPEPRRRRSRRNHRYGLRHRAPRPRGSHQVTRNYIDDDKPRSARIATAHRSPASSPPPPTTASASWAWHPDVKLLAYKACWQPSASAAGRCNSFTLAQALADALAAKAQIINLSLVGPGDPLLAALVAKAAQAGVIVVGAASADPRFGFPAKLPQVLPVIEAEDAAARGRGSCALPRATSSRWCRTVTTISRPAARSPRRRSPASSPCCWRATRSSAPRGCVSC